MPRKSDFLAATAIEAGKLLQEQGIGALPINPFEIAGRLSMVLMPLPKNIGGASGMLIRHENEFGIFYPTHLDNKGFQNFSVAHEIGHFRLPGHFDAIFDDHGRHYSHAGFQSSNRYEKEADQFAAFLLMPTNLLRNAMRKAGEGMRAIEMLAGICKTSLEATAIRYVQTNLAPVAVIISEGAHVKYCSMSDSLKDFSNLDWICRGTPLPINSVTAAFNADKENIRCSKREDGESSLQDWFNGSSRQKIHEEVMGLGRYEKTLTVLTGMEFPDEVDEDEDNEESWIPKFSR